MKKLILIALMFALPHSANAAKAVMEGMQATNSAIFISTVTGSVYVRTAGTVTVSGNAFSVGGSSFVVQGGEVTIGTVAVTTYDRNLTVSILGPGTKTAALNLSGSANTNTTTMGAVDFLNNGSRQVAIQAYNNGGVTTSGIAIYTSNSGSVNTHQVDLPGAAVTAGSALCINASRTLTVCTSAVGAGGTCTCP